LHYGTFEYFAQLSALSDKNILLCLMNFQTLWFYSFVFNGFWSRTEEVIWPFRVMCYIMPTRYGYRQLVWSFLNDSPTFSGAILCDYDLSTCPNGFECPGATSALDCFGKTREQVLDSMTRTFPVFGGIEGTASKEIRYLVIITSVAAAIVALMFASASKEHEVIHPANKKPLKTMDGIPNKQQESGGTVSEVMRKVVPTVFLNRCSYAVKRKLILRDVSAQARGGQVFAIMGPSGAGKTTLLNMLMLKAGPGVSYGTVTLNDRPLSATTFSKHCAAVEQVDRLWAYLTCEQQIRYALRLLVQPASKASYLINECGLDVCRHVKAGNDFVKGLSGGQKRRLSVALALAKDPALFILDEPTSGLDAASAAAVMRLLREVSTHKQSIVLSTIHQPSHSVFAALDTVLILSRGRAAYFGATDRMTQYFADLGKPFPSAMNPAEYVLDLVNSDFTDPGEVESMLRSWNDLIRLAFTAHAFPSAATGQILDSTLQRNSILSELRIVLSRQVLLIVLDPLAYILRCVAILITNIFFSVVFVDARKLVQELIFKRVVHGWFVFNMPASLFMFSIISQFEEIKVLTQEFHGGLMRPRSYVLSYTLIQFPLLALLALCVLAPAYAIVNWSAESFPGILLATYLNMWCFEAVAQLFSLEDSAVMGVAQFINTWFTAVLFNGFAIRTSDVPWPFRIYNYVLPLRWLGEGFYYYLFREGHEYDGAQDFYTLGGKAIGAVCPFAKQVAQEDCFGRKGSQILASLRINFSVFVVEDPSMKMICICTSFAAVFRLMHLMKISQLQMKGRMEALEFPPIQPT